MGLKLQRFAEMIERCTVCHDQCMAYTPELRYLHDHAQVTSRKALLLHLIGEGVMEYNEKTAEIMYSAVNSGLQSVHCMFPSGQDETAFVRAARMELAQAGLLPKEVKKVLETVRRTGNVFGITVEPTIQGEGSVALIFDGATHALAPQTREAAVLLLQRLGLSVQVIDVPSAGYPELDLGFLPEAEAAAKTLVGLLHQSGAERVYSTDPAVVYALREMVPRELGITELPPVAHLSELLSRDEWLRKLNFHRFEKTVTYHDCSEMARYLGILEEPRKILRSIPGLELKEMRFSGKYSRPTGAKPGTLHAEKAVLLAIERIKQAREVGADLIVTASPYSYHHLSQVKNGLPVKDIVELLEELTRVS